MSDHIAKLNDLLSPKPDFDDQFMDDVVRSADSLQNTSLFRNLECFFEKKGKSGENERYKNTEKIFMTPAEVTFSDEPTPKNTYKRRLFIETPESVSDATDDSSQHTKRDAMILDQLKQLQDEIHRLNERVEAQDQDSQRTKHENRILQSTVHKLESSILQLGANVDIEHSTLNGSRMTVEGSK